MVCTTSANTASVPDTASTIIHGERYPRIVLLIDSEYRIHPSTYSYHQLEVVLNTHIHPTHFLRAWICWCAWDIIISISLSPNSLYVCILCMTSTMLRPLASYTHTPILPSVCTYVHPCLGQYYTVLPRSLLLHVCVPHTYTHTMYVHLCTIQYTLRTTM